MSENDDVIRVPLIQPIQAHDKEISELVINKPRPVDCRAVKGIPYQIGMTDGSMNINYDIAAQYLVRCAKIPMSSVDSLCLEDFNAACQSIATFFTVTT